MVATFAIALALWLAAPAHVDSANLHWSLAVDETPQEPAPKEQQKPPDVTADAHVKLRDGKPAAGAKITLTRPDGSRAETFADSNGKFQITGPEGRYALAIQAADKGGTFAATLAKGGLTPAEFILQ
jgi:hypothetical protein